MSALFNAKIFELEGASKLACVIAGYRGKASGYDKVAQVLKNRGYAVAVYEHTPAVLTKGDPQQLITLVDDICRDVTARSRQYNDVICVGASIGAGLCFAVQNRVPKVKFGVYAGAGVSPPETIFKAPLFLLVRRKFTKAGFTPERLKAAWQPVDILPTQAHGHTPFVIVLGKKDKIVNYQKALATFQAWQQSGQPIKVFTKARLGHIGVLRWHKKHIEELLDAAEALAKTTA